MTVNQTHAYMEVAQMVLMHTCVYVIQVIAEQTVLKVQISFTYIGFTINCNNTSIKDINDCKPEPCIHGSCIDGINSYICSCNIGYSGTNCDEGRKTCFIYLFCFE